MFQITGIKIGEKSVGRKVLKDSFYSFISLKDEVPDNLYGSNISLSAIVGMNGSGKTSIIDMIFRILNNLNAMMSTTPHVDYNPFAFIEDLDATLYFVNEKSETGYISCKKNKVEVKLPNKVEPFIFGENSQLSTDVKLPLNGIPDGIINELLDGLFYCIAVNFAPFAYNDRDFSDESCMRIENDLVPHNTKRSLNWLQGIFHKNDGYLSGITLVPYRNKGSFDVEKEKKIAKNRFICILKFIPSFLEGYILEEVKYAFDKNIFDGKFSITTPYQGNNFKPLHSKDPLMSFENILSIKATSIASEILRGYGIEKNIIFSKKENLTPYLYLVYKTLNCAKYPTYHDYRFIQDVNLSFVEGDSYQKERGFRLAKAIMNDDSHRTFKIHQTLRYLRFLDKLKMPDVSVKKEISLEDYLIITSGGFYPEKHTPEELMQMLPPPFLKPSIMLKDSDGTIVNFDDLSSGEKQFFNVCGAVVYQILNLQSLLINLGKNFFPSKSYKRVLVILDEIEICFHPEMQRNFFKKLFSLIIRLGLADFLKLHFIASTHSPFILSDIPKGNILYLKDGKTVDSDIFINPFAANINDILAQSFFLGEKGFIGEMAKESILSLFEFLKSKEDYNKWNADTAYKFIKIIGEPIIRRDLSSLYAKKFKDKTLIQREIDFLKRMMEESE